MKIDDQVLSAFLDAELNDEQMQIVRASIADDETLCDRLAELAAVDQHVKQYSKQIDEQPVPDSISALLAEGENHNVVSMTKTKPTPVKTLSAMAIAASAIFAITLTFMQPGDNKYEVLAATPSGVEASYSDGSITPQLSFTNQQGQLCRVYLDRQPQQVSQNLACRNDQGWVEKTAPIAVQDNQQSYQTASASNPLDTLLDEMMVGTALNAEQEQHAIATNWQSQ